MLIKTAMTFLKDFVLLMMYGKTHHTPPSLQLYGEILLLLNPLSECKISFVSVFLYFHVDFLLSLDYSCCVDCRVCADTILVGFWLLGCVVDSGCNNWATSSHISFTFERWISRRSSQYHQQARSSQSGVWCSIHYYFVCYHVNLISFSALAGYWNWFTLSIFITGYSWAGWG